MPANDLTQQSMVILETMVDAHGLDSVLMALSEICGMKAEHVTTVYQDVRLAKQWATMEGAIGVIVPQSMGL